MLWRSIKCSDRYILYYLPHMCGRALVMMSVKGGVGSFGEAGRITALSKLGD